MINLKKKKSSRGKDRDVKPPPPKPILVATIAQNVEFYTISLPKESSIDIVDRIDGRSFSSASIASVNYSKEILQSDLQT